MGNPIVATSSVSAVGTAQTTRSYFPKSREYIGQFICLAFKCFPPCSFMRPTEGALRNDLQSTKDLRSKQSDLGEEGAGCSSVESDNPARSSSASSDRAIRAFLMKVKTSLMEQEGLEDPAVRPRPQRNSNLTPRSATVDIVETLQELIKRYEDAPDDVPLIEVQDLAMKIFRSAISKYLEKDLEQALYITDSSKETVLDMVVAAATDNGNAFKTVDEMVQFVATMPKRYEAAKCAIRAFLGGDTRHRFILRYYAAQEKQDIKLTPEQHGDAGRRYEKIIEIAADKFGISKDAFITAVNTEINSLSEEKRAGLGSWEQVTKPHVLRGCARKALESTLETIKEDLKEDESYLVNILSSTKEIDDKLALSDHSKELLSDAICAEVRKFLLDDVEAQDFVDHVESGEISTMGDLRKKAQAIYIDLMAHYELTKEVQGSISERYKKIAAYSSLGETLSTLLEGFVGARKIGISNRKRLGDPQFEPMKDRAAAFFESAKDIDLAMKQAILKSALEMFLESVGRGRRRKSENTAPNLSKLSDLSDHDLIRFKDQCRSTDFMRRVVNDVYSQKKTHIKELSIQRW